jgi:hypothetical protein
MFKTLGRMFAGAGLGAAANVGITWSTHEMVKAGVMHDSHWIHPEGLTSEAGNLASILIFLGYMILTSREEKK